MKMKSENSADRVIAHLLWDEMDICQELTFRNDRYHGYVEMGLQESQESDSRLLAKKALVFIVTAVNGRWKLPIGYFLVDSINAKD